MKDSRDAKLNMKSLEALKIEEIWVKLKAFLRKEESPVQR